jgi:hypothetical protein
MKEKQCPRQGQYDATSDQSYIDADILSSLGVYHIIGAVFPRMDCFSVCPKYR